MSMKNFRGEDMPGFKVSFAENKGKKSSKADSGKASAGSVSGVPEGTKDEVMDWVGDDADKAQQALDAENSAEKPRVTLVEELERVIHRDEEADAAVDGGADGGE